MPFGARSTYYVTFTMKLFGTKYQSVHVRPVHANHDTETHGQYLLGELAYIERVDDTNYVTSVAIGGRRDEMGRDARNTRDRERASRELARRAGNDEV